MDRKLSFEGEAKRVKFVRLTSLVYNGICNWMIRSYRNRETERLGGGERVRQWEPFRRQAEKRLRILEAAKSLGDLAGYNSMGKPLVRPVRLEEV